MKFSSSGPRKFVAKNRKNEPGYKATLLPMKSETQADETYGSLGMFYINPASWTESKTSHWVKQEIPGYSDPHQQWISSGARQITFDALVTNDRAEGHINANTENITITDDNKSLTSKFKSTAIKAIGGIAKQVFNIPELSLKSLFNDNNRNQAQELSLDITAKLNYYRSLIYPKTKEGKLTDTPPLVRLRVGSSFGNRTKGSKFVVDKVDIRITKQLADLTPCEATVSFTLTEFPGKMVSFNDVNKDI